MHMSNIHTFIHVHIYIQQTHSASMRGSSSSDEEAPLLLLFPPASRRDSTILSMGTITRPQSRLWGGFICMIREYVDQWIRYLSVLE